jgi:pimeloyl-ACP methyl ester carboxylesterase
VTHERPTPGSRSEMPEFANDGLTLSYRDEGRGPAIVLLHGWGADGAEWESFGWTDALRRERRILAPDLRGHGSSAKPHEVDRYQPAVLAADVAAMLDAAQIDEADLFGYSLGGAVALWACVLVPNRFRSLIVGGVGGEPELTAAIGQELLADHRSERTEAYRRYALESKDADLVALAACLRSGISAPPCVELAVYGGEALVASGDLDRRRDATETLAGCLPGGRFLFLPGADHMGAFAHDDFKMAAAAFLGEVSPT